MKRVWYRQDRAAVLDALRQGQRPELATTMACAPWRTAPAFWSKPVSTLGLFFVTALPAVHLG